MMTVETRFAALAITLAVGVSAGAALAQPATADEVVITTHAVTDYGDPPLYPADFPHWNYVDPDAPKGGELRLSAFGGFDSFNSYIISGTPAAGVSLIYDSLISSNADEGLLAYYADLAHTIEHNEARTWAIFHMRPEARFHDGHPITAEDVVFTHETLRDQGAPRFRDRFYDDIASVEAIDDHTVRIEASNPSNTKVIFQIATFPIFPAHWWAGREFGATSLEAPLGSGPYRIADFDSNRWIVYERVEDYWAADLPQNIGQFNFDRIRYDYYRDPDVMDEAFIGGEYDFMTTIQSVDWATRFGDAPPILDGRIIMEQIPSDEPESWFGLMMNLRRPELQDPRVREALTYFYDFETARRTIHYGLFTRVNSYFPNADMASSGLPEGDELALLERYRDQMPDRVRERIFTEVPSPPTTDGSGNIRRNLRTALGLMRQAGWEVVDGVMTDTATGEAMELEVLYRSPNLDRVLLPIQQTMERAGISLNLRLADPAQFTRRLDEFDYDLIMLGLVQFYPPGAALRGLWGSEQAGILGGENFSGIQDPVLDQLIEYVVEADSLPAVRSAAHALDRYVLWNFVSIPLYYDDTYRIAYWDMFGRPEVKPRFSLGFPTTWWYQPDNPAAARDAR